MFTKQQFERLASAHMDGVFRLAYSYLKSAAEADDVTQNALLKLYLTDKRFESEAHVKNWLYRVAANECKRALLSPWRRAEDIADYAEALAFTTPERSELFYAVMAAREVPHGHPPALLRGLRDAGDSRDPRHPRRDGPYPAPAGPGAAEKETHGG